MVGVVDININLIPYKNSHLIPGCAKTNTTTWAQHHKSYGF